MQKSIIAVVIAASFASFGAVANNGVEGRVTALEEGFEGFNRDLTSVVAVNSRQDLQIKATQNMVIQHNDHIAANTKAIGDLQTHVDNGFVVLNEKTNGAKELAKEALNTANTAYDKAQEALDKANSVKDGVDGKDGATGATGAQGIQGIQGIQGEKGEKGDTGLLDEVEKARIESNIASAQATADANTTVLAGVATKVNANTQYIAQVQASTSKQLNDQAIAINQVEQDVADVTATANSNTASIATLSNKVTSAQQAIVRINQETNSLRAADAEQGILIQSNAQAIKGVSDRVTVVEGAVKEQDVRITSAQSTADKAKIMAANAQGSADKAMAEAKSATREAFTAQDMAAYAQHSANAAQDMAKGAIAHSVGVGEALKSGFEAQARENAKIHARIDNVEKDVKNLKAGVAGAIAIGMLDVPAYGTHGVGVAVGGYESASALAVGYTVRFNERTNGKVAVALDSANNASYGASVGYSW